MSTETLDDYLEPLGAPEWSDQLDEAIDDRAPAYDRFSIPDDAAADWALRKIAKAQAAIDAAEQVADERRALIDRWLQDSTASDRSTVEFMTGLLSEYHGRVLAEDPDRKTLDLPAGRVKSRTTKPAVVIEDLDTVAEWCGSHMPDAVTYTPKVSVRDIRNVTLPTSAGRAVDAETGEVVPGLGVRDGQTTFTVDLP